MQALYLIKFEKVMRVIEEYQGVPLVIPSELMHGENCYTMLTGKNGVGKSRLISELAREYTERYDVHREEYVFHNHYKSVDQPKIIAVSTSPFDKFPLHRKRPNTYEISNYRYVGIRSAGAFGASAISLISSAMSGIFEKLTMGWGYDRLIKIFDVLGFAPEVQFVFKLNNVSNYNSERYELNFDTGNELHDILRDRGIPLEPRVLESLEGLD
ncbi:hypothetical protein [Photobacterium carnosum]|uniref:Uncharacterized protein n=1 Tax=Photobacterium carnosum TaxID=2023717 RepID=A0A2N4UWM7_9GAMM|nr:hypothetical protein [Photobacterium carnosum]PLC59432.1 hypothetical protein CIK00_00005 [Photobacterium carnosum]